jgi:hypothetical protein
MCEKSGKYCLGAPNLAVDHPVVEAKKGRAINFIFLSNPNNKLHEELQLAASPKECVAAASNGIDVVLHHCNGGLGTAWIISGNNPPLLFRSVEFPTETLAGHNNGTQYHVNSKGQKGWYYKFKDFACCLGGV